MQPQIKEVHAPAASNVQQLAADPSHSVWVSASAGTGKTKILTDRVLRLLLEGIAPQHILCLTFTNAAAAEMAARVHATLARWAIADDVSLSSELAALIGQQPGSRTLTLSRTLFTRVIDSQENLRIQTLHAFCQSLLRRFSLEAGVNPHFKVIEQQTANELLAEARNRLFAHSDSPQIKQALSAIASTAHEMTLASIFTELVKKRSQFSPHFNRPGGLENYLQQLRKSLKLEEEVSEQVLLREACAGNHIRVTHAAEALQGGNDNDKMRGDILANWLEADIDGRMEQFFTYAGVFLNKDNSPTQTPIATKKVPGWEGVREILQQEQERIFKVVDKLKSLHIYDLTASLLTLAQDIFKFYEQLKRERGVLDYEDLILLTRQLLQKPDITPWIMYKLDGQIDHLLIDEAQDTSPAQWEIISALCEEFFAGETSEEKERTIFVVGDKKQSIFSFQGAEPAKFNETHAYFQQRTEEARKLWHTLTLDTSFRSTEPVLALVDEVFSDKTLRSAITLSEESVNHQAHRLQHQGVVELWPLVTGKERAKEEPWPLPIEYKTKEDPKAILAEQIADQIRSWLDEKRMLAPKGRPVRPGDIMILIRKRDTLVEHLLRTLKHRDIPVAGADRLNLTDHIAIKDLIALGNFLLLPEDDLNLAALLKSPLFSINEEELFALCYNRQASLWQQLKDNPSHQEAVDYLSNLLSRADFMPPFEFYTQILDAQDGRKKFAARLGKEVNELFDEFLALVLKYEQSHTPSLQGFLAWLDSGTIEIKRDMEQRHDEVRIMTIHGAKGLQAPIVFLPDTTNLPSLRDKLLWDGGGMCYWSAGEANMNAITRRLKDQIGHKQREEYYRLLYVALTRAEDELYICGVEGAKKTQDEQWYMHIKRAMQKLGREVTYDFAETPGYRLSSEQKAPVEQRAITESQPPKELPEFLSTTAPSEPIPPRPLTPSKPTEDEPAVLSPLENKSHNERGILIHRLLEILPGMPADRQASLAQNYLQQHASNYDKKEALIEEVLAVLHHPEFTPLFGPNSQAEVPITAVIGSQVVSGQVDRLVVTDDKVLIIDYKTNRQTPEAIENIPTTYLKQMAIYRAVVKQIYPNKTIHCALLWTENLKLFPIPREVLDNHAPTA